MHSGVAKLGAGATVTFVETRLNRLESAYWSSTDNSTNAEMQDQHIQLGATQIKVAFFMSLFL